jgi:fibronectin-binding autotransporter adhesin
MKIPGTLLLRLSFIVVTLAQVTRISAADFSAIWDGGNGNWDDPLHWNTNPNYPNNSGGFTYDATINIGLVSLDRDITIQRLVFNNGYLDGPFGITLNEGLDWGEGWFRNVHSINLGSGSVSTIGPLAPGHSRVLYSSTLNNSGVVNQSGVVDADQNSIINNLAGATWNLQQGAGFGRYSSGGPAFTFNNSGNLVVSGVPYPPFVLINNGTVNLTSGGNLLLEAGGTSTGTFNVDAQAGLNVGDFVAYNFGAGTTINGTGSIFFQNVNVVGNTTVNANVTRAEGTLDVQSGATLTLNGSFTNFGVGDIVNHLSGGTINSIQPLSFNRGTLSGSGTINANVSLAQDAILAFELGGAMAGSGANRHDQLHVNGVFTLGGILSFGFKSNFEASISSSDTFALVTSTSPLAGSFSNVASGTRYDTTDGFGSFLVNYAGSSLTLTNYVPNTRWLGGSGNWTDASHWSSSPDYPHNSGSKHYDAAIHSGSVNLDTNVTLSRFLLTGGTLGGSNTLTITDGFIWTLGILGGGPGSTINLAPGSISRIDLPGVPANAWLSGRTINNAGIVNQGANSRMGIDTNCVINNLAGGTWTLGPNAGLGDNRSTHSAYLIFNNFGNLVVHNDGLDGHSGILGAFNNIGTVSLQASGNQYTTFGFGEGTATGTFDVPTHTILQFGNALTGASYIFGSGATVNGAGLTNIDYQARLSINGDSTINTDFTNHASLTIQSGATLTLHGSFDQLSGFTPTTRLNGGTITSTQPLSFQAGLLVGSGTINGNINNNAVISPGASAGTITVNGNISLLGNSKLVMEIGGVVQGGAYDYLAVSGMVGLDGILELHMLNGFQLKLEPGQIFTLLTSNNLLEGVFDNIASGARLTTADGLASFQVNYGAGSKYGANNLVLSDPRAVPEPASVMLFAGGALALTLLRVRRR